LISLIKKEKIGTTEVMVKVKGKRKRILEKKEKTLLYSSLEILGRSISEPIPDECRESSMVIEYEKTRMVAVIDAKVFEKRKKAAEKMIAERRAEKLKERKLKEEDSKSATETSKEEGVSKTTTFLNKNKK